MLTLPAGAVAAQLSWTSVVWGKAAPSRCFFTTGFPFHNNIGERIPFLLAIAVVVCSSRTTCMYQLRTDELDNRRDNLGTFPRQFVNSIAVEH